MNAWTMFLIGVGILIGLLFIAKRIREPSPQQQKNAAKSIGTPKPSQPNQASTRDTAGGAEILYLYPHSTQGHLFGGDAPRHHFKHDEPAEHRNDEDKSLRDDSDTTGGMDSSSDGD